MRGQRVRGVAGGVVQGRRMWDHDFEGGGVPAHMGGGYGVGSAGYKRMEPPVSAGFTGGRRGKRRASCDVVGGGRRCSCTATAAARVA